MTSAQTVIGALNDPTLKGYRTLWNYLAGIESMGLQHNRRFEAEIKIALDGIGSRDAKKFERGQLALGKLLGFPSGKKESSGSPDPWLVLDQKGVLVFEDHSDANSTFMLSITKARQACLHLSASTRVIPVLVSPVQRIDEPAKVHLNEVRFWKIDEFRQWATNAIATLREVRSAFGAIEYSNWATFCETKFNDANATPAKLIQMVDKMTVSKFLGGI